MTWQIKLVKGESIYHLLSFSPSFYHPSLTPFFIFTFIPQPLLRNNHEIWNGFIAYQSRWIMPNATVYGQLGGPNNSSWYSLDFGSAHIVWFNTETPEDTGEDCTFFGPIMRDQVEAVFASTESRVDLVLGARDFAATAVRDGIMINGTRMYGGIRIEIIMLNQFFFLIFSYSPSFLLSSLPCPCCF